MFGKLPFSASVFWKTFIAVIVLTVVAWTVAVKGFHYVMTPADYVGTTISGILLTYLIHLWILPADMLVGGPDSDPTANELPPGSAQNRSHSS